MKYLFPGVNAQDTRRMLFFVLLVSSSIELLPPLLVQLEGFKAPYALLE